MSGKTERTEDRCKKPAAGEADAGMSRRNVLLGGTTLGAALALGSAAALEKAHAQQAAAAPSGKAPNFLVIWGDDIGTWNISHNSHGMMGYTTPNIDRIAREGVSFTDY
jgi:arylsulfatase